MRTSETDYCFSISALYSHGVPTASKPLLWASFLHKRWIVHEPMAWAVLIAVSLSAAFFEE